MALLNPFPGSSGIAAAVFRVQLTMVLLCLATLSALGQAVEEYQVKAAFLYNFARFVEWPAHTFKSTNDPLVICILGEDPFGHLLENTVQGKTIEGRPIVLRSTSEVGQTAGCHVLFVSLSERRQLSSILAGVSSTGVLTVGETAGFAALGGVINFKLENERRIRFEVNLAAAREADLKISSKLLSLALIVRK
jgi:hypothetical protein